MLMQETTHATASALMGGYSPLAMIVIDPFTDQLLAANPAACELLCIEELCIENKACL